MQILGDSQSLILLLFDDNAARQGGQGVVGNDVVIVDLRPGPAVSDEILQDHRVFFCLHYLVAISAGYDVAPIVHDFGTDRFLLFRQGNQRHPRVREVQLPNQKPQLSPPGVTRRRHHNRDGRVVLIGRGKLENCCLVQSEDIGEPRIIRRTGATGPLG